MYWSLVREEAASIGPPQWLHFVKRGRTLGAVQRQSGQEVGSLWADPGFRNPTVCDFRPLESAPRRFGPEEPPPMARGQPGGGDGGGCSSPAGPGAPSPRGTEVLASDEGGHDSSAPASIKPLTPQTLAALMPQIGAHLISEHAEAQAQAAQEAAAQVEALQALVHFAHARLRRYGRPCWLAPAARRQARYLPGCTNDACHGYASTELAAAACDALDGGCGGVTVNEASGRFETRAGHKLRRDGPAEEVSWIRRRCETDDDGDGTWRWSAEVSAVAAGGGMVDTCSMCRAVVADVLVEIGSRRRTEVEVIGALEHSCARLADLMLGAGRRSRIGSACDGFIERHAETLEERLTGSKPSHTPADLCEGVDAICGTK